MGEFGSKCQEKKQPDHPVQLQPIPTQGTDRHGKRSEPTAAAACHIGLEECNPVSLTLSVSHRKTDEFPWIMHDELSLFAPLSRRPVNVGFGGGGGSGSEGSFMGMLVNMKGRWIWSLQREYQ